MPYKKHTTTKLGSSPPRALAGGGFGLIVLVVAWLWLAEKPDPVRKPLPEMMLVPAPSVVAPAAEKAKPLKLVYRNSVIPGGVHSAAELAAAVQRDPVVAAHYADFDVAVARLVRVEQSRLVHVSYRIGDNIYWTRKKVRLAMGENLLSDGKHLARTRCGNLIADEPEGPVLDNEPAPEVLEAVFLSSEDLIDQTANMPAPAAVATTAATAEQPTDVRVASRMQSVAPVPAIVFPNLWNLWNLRNPAQSAPALRVDAITLAPPVVERFDADVFGAVVGGTPPEPPGTPPADRVPEGTQPQSPVTPDSKTPKTPKTPDTPTPDSPPPFTPPPTFGPQPVALTAATSTPVPEPGSGALVGLALIVLTLVRRRGRPGRQS
jgi:hypothetical protein